MKVYELIQELANFDADCEIEINVKLNKTSIEIDDIEEDDERYKLVSFDDNCDLDNVTSRKSYYGTKKETVILEAEF